MRLQLVTTLPFGSTPQVNRCTQGAMHLQRDLVYTAASYGTQVLEISADDVVFSAAKLFFRLRIRQWDDSTLCRCYRRFVGWAPYA